MTSTKFFVLALTLLAVQTQAYPQAPVNGTIIDIIKKILPVVEEAVEWLINHIYRAIDEFDKDADKLQVKLLAVAGKALDIVLDITHKVLEKLKEKADPSTIKIITCVEASREASKKVSLDFLNNTSKCIIPHLTDLLKLVKDLKPDLDKLTNDLSTAANGIQKCGGSDFEELTCALGVVKDLVDVIKNTRPEVIEKVTGLIKDSLKVLKDVYPTCIAPNVQKLIEARADVVISISKCIAA